MNRWYQSWKQKEEVEHQNDIFVHMGELVAKGNSSEEANCFLGNFRYYNNQDIAEGASKDFWKTTTPNLPVFFQELNQAYKSKEPESTDPSVLREIKVPFLLLKGSQSHFIFNDSVHHCSKYLANPEVRQIDRTGHFGPYIRPEAVAGELVEFFEKVLIRKE